MSWADIRNSRLSPCVWGEPEGKQAKGNNQANKSHCGEQHTLEVLCIQGRKRVRFVEVALVAIVRFRDGQLAHEHIYAN